jgi:hypothetical protein
METSYVDLTLEEAKVIQTFHDAYRILTKIELQVRDHQQCQLINSTLIIIPNCYQYYSVRIIRNFIMIRCFWSIQFVNQKRK